MRQFSNLLVATDCRFDDHPIVEESAEIASHCGASLTIVDIVPEFPWSARMLLHGHKHFRELMVKEKHEKLEALAAPIRARGIPVQIKVLVGKSSVEIIREVIRNDHDLVLRVAKGTQSRRGGFFGATAFGLLRKCPCAVWLVSPTAGPKFKHVLGCVDVSTDHEIDDGLNEDIYDLSLSISRYHQGRFSIAHAWSIWNEQMLKRRLMPHEFEELESRSEQEVADSAARFLARHQDGVLGRNVHLLRGEPEIAISGFTRKQNVDLVVMGTVARSGLSGLVMGNTAERILNHLQCSVLALKPDSFVSPVALDESCEATSLQATIT